MNREEMLNFLKNEARGISVMFGPNCETIVHDMPREEAMKYVDELAIFFHSGWSGLLRLE